MYNKQILLIYLLVHSIWGMAQPVGWASVGAGTTGGEGGPVVVVTNRSELVQWAAGDAPRILHIQDTIALNLYERVRIGANKTLLGVTQDAMLRFGGIEVIGNNVIVQNLVIGDFYDGDWGGTTHSTDAITVYGQHVWIDHCWLWGAADGLFDARSGNNNIANYVTISNTRFSDQNKVSLIGSSDSDIECRDHLKITYHQCWFDGTLDKGLNQRLPRVRFGDVHILNCYYEEVDSYCAAARFESDLVVESTYFRNVKDPHEIEDLGLGLRDPQLVAIGNLYEHTTGNRMTAGTAFVPADFYTYSPVPTFDVPWLVINAAGPFNRPDNAAPVAEIDFVNAMGLGSAFAIAAADNDTDADADDLRIAQIANTPRGTASIRQNRIQYVRPANPTGQDTVLYLLADTQGGIDTGVVVINFDISSATHAADAANSLRIYPNPTRTDATLTWETPLGAAASIRIYDMQGRVVWQTLQLAPAATSYRLPTTALPHGTYTVLLESGGRTMTQQLIIAQ